MVAEAELGRGQHRLQVLEALSRLLADIAIDELARCGIEMDLP